MKDLFHKFRKECILEDLEEMLFILSFVSHLDVLPFVAVFVLSHSDHIQQ